MLLDSMLPLLLQHSHLVDKRQLANLSVVNGLWWRRVKQNFLLKYLSNN